MLMQSVLVTGATGFIGRHVVQQLLGGSARVRVLVRRPDSLDRARRSQLEVVQGDVRDPVAVLRAVRGVDCILHLAGLARVWAKDRGEFHAINVEGVDHVLCAARSAGMPRLVHVSTVLTLPPFRPAPVSGDACRPTPYEESKRAGEDRVAEYVAAGGDAIVVHPTRVYGPGPLTDANAVSRTIALYLRGRFRLRLDDGDAQANYVHVADVATGIIHAARYGHAGEHYVLGGQNASLQHVLQLAGGEAGVRRWVIRVPVRPALVVARALELWGRATGGPMITPAWVRVLLQDQRVDARPSMTALRCTARPLAEGIRELVHFLDADSGQRHA
jgi:nucleoside-diphosphate-sugar epimerase